MSLWYNQGVPQISSVEDLIQIIRQHPEWREALLSALLPQDLLLLPQEFRDFRAEMREPMEAHERRIEAIEEQIARQRLEYEQQMQQMRIEFQQQMQGMRAEFTARFERIEQDVEDLKKDMKEVKNDLASVKGMVLEMDWGRRAKSLFGRLSRQVTVYASGEFYDREIEKRVALESSKVDQLLELDYVIWGVRRSDGTEIILEVEVSWGVGVKDVTRARERAAILRECGYPVAVGRFVTPKARALAGREGVVLITDSKIEGEDLLKHA